jgi:hypothetical protein
MEPECSIPHLQYSNPDPDQYSLGNRKQDSIPTQNADGSIRGATQKFGDFDYKKGDGGN